MVYRYCKYCFKRMGFANDYDTRAFCSPECRNKYLSNVNTNKPKEDDLEGPDMPPLTKLSDEGARILSSKIVNQVIGDYRRALRKLKKKPHNKEAIERILELRDEIMSDYFSIVSMGQDAEAMIRQIEVDFEKQWEEEQRKKRKKECMKIAEHDEIRGQAANSTDGCEDVNDKGSTCGEHFTASHQPI